MNYETVPRDVKVKSLHLLSKFRGLSLMDLEKNRFENCHVTLTEV